MPAIDAASVQEVQPYCSMWDAIYDCLFFCINQDIYDSLTPEQQQVVDEAGQKAVEYERYINRSGDEEIMSRWEKSNGVTFTKKEDMDIDSFKKAVDGIDDWFVKELKSAGYDDAQDLVDLFTEDSVDTVEDYSDLNWPETTWNFACSTTETSTWADGGRKFGELMEKATGGKVKVNIYAADQLTNGNQSEGIQALMNGDPVQISMHSNLIYSAFDPRFNVVSLPFIYDSYDGTTEGSAKVIDELKAGTLKAEDYDRFNEFMDTFDLLSQYNINGEDPLGALYDQDPIFLADGDAALWINGCWAWPNLKEAGASDSDEYGFIPYVLGNDTSDFANNGIQASAIKQLMIDAEQSTPEQQEAAKAFVNWLVYSDNGQKMLVEDAAVIPACKNNTYEVLDPLGKDIQAKMAAGNTYSSSYIAPSDHWSVLGASMQKYLGGQCTRDDLAADIDNYWTSQN